MLVQSFCVVTRICRGKKSPVVKIVFKETYSGRKETHGCIEFLVPIDRLQDFRSIRIWLKKVKESCFEFIRVERLAAPGGEIVRNEFVPLGLANKLLKVVEEVKSLGNISLESFLETWRRINLLVRDTAESVIWILALQINDKFGELMILSEKLDRVLCIFCQHCNKLQKLTILPRAFHPMMAEKSR
jgi:hypothetical protein